MQGLIAASFIYSMAQNDGTSNGGIKLATLKKAEHLYRKESGKLPMGVRFRVWQHNYRVIVKLLESSVNEQCECFQNLRDSDGKCLQIVCQHELPPFKDIVKGVRRIYEDSILLRESEHIARILWNNMPDDSFVYLKESPNYCEPEAVPNWLGMAGRRCSEDFKVGTDLDSIDVTHCQRLCRRCSYGVRLVEEEQKTTKKECNCRFTSNFQMKCDVCKEKVQHLQCF